MSLKMTKPLFGLTLLVAVAVVGYGAWSIQQVKAQAAQAQAAPASGPVVDLLATARQEPGAEVLPSGVIYRSLQEGTGRQPRATDTVKVHYRGVLANGQEFDSSLRRGTPAEFPLNAVIPCWTEAVQKIKAGGKARLTCPAATAYGDKGAGGVIPPGAVLQFEIEVLAVIF